VKFLRQLAAAALVVAAVVVLGVAWNRFAASTLTGPLPSANQQEFAPGREVARPQAAKSGTHLSGSSRSEVVGFGTLNLGLSSMFDPANLPDLRHTVVIESGVLAAVVIIDVSRRKLRRAKRARAQAKTPA
jgi:hypothetical protein